MLLSDGYLPRYLLLVIPGAVLALWLGWLTPTNAPLRELRVGVGIILHLAITIFSSFIALAYLALLFVESDL